MVRPFCIKLYACGACNKRYSYLVDARECCKDGRYKLPRKAYGGEVG